MKNEIKVEFRNEFKGKLTTTTNSELTIGLEQIRPYDMMLGALVSCYHATFLDILQKKRQVVEHVSYQVTGTKRTEVPTTLEHVLMSVKVVGVSDETQANKCFELAKKYCSVYSTISHVAEIEVVISYE